MKRLLVIWLAVCLLLLSGCIEGDISHIGIVKGVAFDVGETGTYRMTLCVLGKDGGGELLSAEGDTIGEMKAEIAKKTSKYPFGGHNQIVLISDELKSSEYIIKHFASEEGQRNGAEYIAIVKGEAAPCLTLENDGLIAPVDSVGIIDDAQENGEILRATALMVKNASEGIGNSITVPYCAVEDERFTVLGMAVLNDYQVTGILTEREALGARFLLNGSDRMRMVVDQDGVQADVELRDIRVELAVKERGYEVTVEALVETGRREDRKKLLEIAQGQIEDCIREAFAAAQEEGDFLNLAARTLNGNPQMLEQYRDSWQERLRELSMTVTVKLN